MIAGTFSSLHLSAPFLIVLVLGAHHHHHRTTTTPKPTTPASTPRPTPESFEYTYTFFYYDTTSHYMCCAHATRLLRVCLCYHVPQDERQLMQEQEKLLEIEERIYSLYVAGHYTSMNDLQFYSKPNYDMCTGQGKQLNTTLLHVY
ncbi:uncharacterized protein LOC128184636 [Crassostrea angulata]|uniref:Uncharacterized protein n=1 Tax=Magallana gigas TaxID=29159 RepID=A0A8W8J5W5_MAGGI|nr:uncharacterized protein LOC105323819 [Crassostrea gigas]XP_052710155.1 uncharacterized protein LOC128184636 [Crassostrea angulata]